ncbi:MFS transporter [Halostella pelagica]|uniref:MFS transporter n=1 Tax=Halostella pelagica TaxID=2583824 RepID=UPI001080449F|nr:MFS transporter [Halostella pelagica]
MVDSARVYRGWSVVAGCFLGALVVFGVSYSYSVFLEPIQRDLGLSRADVSLVFSVQTAVIYVSAAGIGVLADRYGVRRLLGLGGGLFVAGTLLATRARSLLTLLLSYGVLTAVGLGAVYVVSYATVPRWFRRRRGLAAGVATAGLGVGMLVVAPAASVLVSSAGWRAALLAVALGAALLLAVAVTLVADDPPSQGIDASVEFPTGYPERPPTDWSVYRDEVVAVAASRTFLLVFVGWVLVYATLYVVFVHVVAHAGAVGIGERVGALALAVIGATTSVARIAVGWGADRVGRHRTFVACSAAMGASTLALPLVESAVGLYAFAVVYGVAYGGNGALLSPLTTDLFGTTNPNAVFGLVSLSFAVSGLVAPWAAGLTFDVTGTYAPAFVAAGAVGLVGTGLVAAARTAPRTS